MLGAEPDTEEPHRDALQDLEGREGASVGHQEFQEVPLRHERDGLLVRRCMREVGERDLLTLRMGFGQPLVPPNTHPIQKAAEAAGLRTLGPPKPAAAVGPDEWLARFSKGIVGILLTQALWSPAPPDVWRDFWRIAYTT